MNGLVTSPHPHRMLAWSPPISRWFSAAKRGLPTSHFLLRNLSPKETHTMTFWPQGRDRTKQDSLACNNRNPVKPPPGKTYVFHGTQETIEQQISQKSRLRIWALRGTLNISPLLPSCSPTPAASLLDGSLPYPSSPGQVHALTPSSPQISLPFLEQAASGPLYLLCPLLGPLFPGSPHGSLTPSLKSWLSCHLSGTFLDQLVEYCNPPPPRHAPVPSLLACSFPFYFGSHAKKRGGGG